MHSPFQHGNPSVSVIIPVFNDESGIARCLDALCAQTYPASQFQVIVIDNDSRPPLVLHGEYPFQLVDQQCTTPGSYAARNAGARIATGTVLAFTDADCVPAADWIERGVSALLDAGERFIIGGDVVIQEPDMRTGVTLYQYVTGLQQRLNIEQNGFAVTANLFCTLEQLKKVGQFDERLFSGGDREWAWRAANMGIGVRFESLAIVSTLPRATLRAAILQARRTTAGRINLRELGLDYGKPEALSPHRSMFQNVFWLLSRQQLSFAERIKVLIAAVIIKSASLVENIRIRLGAVPERR